MRLSEAQIDKEYVVLDVHGKQKQRLESLGFIKKSVVTVIDVNWCGLTVKLLDSRIALSNETAGLVDVMPRRLYDLLNHKDQYEQ